MVLHNVHRQQPAFRRQCDCFTTRSPWIYDNGQPAMAKSSEISDVSAASKLAATSDLAFMFHTVGRVIDHL